MPSLLTIESAPPKWNTQQPHCLYWERVTQKNYNNCSNNPKFLKNIVVIFSRTIIIWMS